MIFLSGNNPPKDSYLHEISSSYRASRGTGLEIFVKGGKFKKKIEETIFNDVVELKKLIVECGGDATQIDIKIK